MYFQLHKKGKEMTKETPAPEIETLCETESYIIWRADEPDGESTYHLELGNLTVHFFDEEWQEFLELAQALVKTVK
jgi:hypothetical protein